MTGDLRTVDELLQANVELLAQVARLTAENEALIAANEHHILTLAAMLDVEPNK